jgi:hypothetical protein
MTSVAPSVVVVEDGSGDLYLITPELLRLARVNSQAHRKLIDQILDRGAAARPLNIGEVGFRVIGTFPRSSNPHLRPDAFDPKILLISSGAMPNP